MLQQNSNAGKLQLNAADLACARQLLEAHKESKDPGPMYDFLASKGDRYAILANGVVKENSIAGRIAINYMRDVGVSHNKPVTETDIKHIGYDMARGYFDTQQDRLDKSPTGIIYGDIDHEQAAQFHNSVFKTHGLPPEAWTLYPVYKVLPKNQHGGHWQSTLNSAGNSADEILLSFNSVKIMVDALSTSPASDQPMIHNWLNIVMDADNLGAAAGAIGSQLFSSDEEVAPVSTEMCPIDINITPTPQAVQRIADEDQAQRDVTNGYLVNKPTHSFSFTDGSLDKTDFTSVQMGGMAAGGIRPGEVQLDPNIQPSRYLSDYYLERPGYMLPETGLFDAATLNGLSAQTTVNTYVDPLLLDLSGKGVSMTGIEDGVLFDTDNSGTLKRTGWAGPDTGMLVLDNGSGKIDNISQMYSEYYGGTAGVKGQPGEKRYQDGFAALASEDSDSNGAIDKHDPIWHKLRIWQDSSHNGRVDPGELKTLDDWRITQIKVDANAVEDNRQGNRVLTRGVFVINGKLQEVLAVNFASSPVSNTVTKRGNEGAIIRSVTDETTTTAYVHFADKGAALSANILKTNNIYGGSRDDILTASPKGSWLVGRGGSNTYIGNSGNDVFVISASDDTKNIKGNGGRDTVLIVGKKGVALNMARSGITVAQGGDGDDIIVSGGNNSVFIKAGKGNTTLVGGGGNDVLAGGSGKNKIVGGSGKAVIYAGSQGDIIYAAEQGSIIYAGGGADRIYGNQGNDVIEAGQGNALIDGGGGINIVALHGSYADYAISQTDSGFEVEDKVAGRDGTLTLKNIQKLNFADISAVALNTRNIMPVDDVLRVNKFGRAINRYQKQRIHPADLLANDLRFNDDSPLRITALTDAIGCRVWLANNGDVEIRPDNKFTGVMSFKYEVKSARGDPAFFVVDLTHGESAVMRATVTLLTPDISHDPLVAKQTYLNDINVIAVWQDYTGKGVRIGQFEPGGQFATGAEIFDIQHPDLAANVDPAWLVTQKSTGTLPADVSNHATMVAGVMVAARNNVGGIGVAYDATLGGHYLKNDSTDLAPLGKMSNYDVVNHSWSISPEFGMGVIEPHPLNLPSMLEVVLQYAAAYGRGGLGTIIVTSGGNQREQGGSAQGTRLNNSRFAIQVGAINGAADLSTLTTRVLPFSNPGASLLVSAPGSHVLSSSIELEAERGAVFGCQYRTEQGTSFAAPIVSGITALMLEANPNLGYRDVQQILALSARRVNDPATQWRINGAKNWNGGGLHVSHDYGFGAVDARAAVRLAENWVSQQTVANQQVLAQHHTPWASTSLPAGETEPSFFTLGSGLNVEQVEVDVSANIGRLGDLTVKLVSPSGSESMLLDRVGRKNTASAAQVTDSGSTLSGDFNYTFMSTHHRGEHSAGQWRLEVTNADHGLPITLNSGSLRLFGSKQSPDDTYFYTDEFAAQVAEQPPRAVLDDAVNGTVGGRNTLNAVAISGNVEINLADGRAKLGGTTLTIRSPETLHNLISGEGNDRLTAGRKNSLLDGGRGQNWLTGGVGKDVFVVRKRAKGSDEIINFDARKGETIHLVGFSGLTFNQLSLRQRQDDTKIKLTKNQTIIIKNQQVNAIKAQNFVFQDRFTAPEGYFNSGISMDIAAPTTPQQASILLSGEGEGVDASINARNKIQVLLVGKVYQPDGAQPSVFVVVPQENTSHYKNLLRGFRQGVDKIDLSALGIRHFSELAVTKRDWVKLQGIAIIQGVEIKSKMVNPHFNPQGETLDLLYLDTLEVAQISAEDFIFADAESMQADAPLAYDDVSQLIDKISDFDGATREFEGLYPPLQIPQFLAATLATSHY